MTAACPSLKTSTPARRRHYLIGRGVSPLDFNSYGARRGHHEVMMRGTFANSRLRNEMVPALRKDGARLSIEFTVLPFHDEAGRMLGIAAILRDVTRRFEEMKELRRQLAARGGNG